MSNKKVDTKKKVNMKKRDRMFIIIIGVVIVIAIIVCIMFAFGGKSKDNDGVTDNQTTNTEEGNTESTEPQIDGQIDYTKNENVKINNNVKENNSQALLKEKTFEGMKVKDIKLTASEGTTKFLANVENTSSTDFVAQRVVIVFKNKDGSEFDRLDTYLGDIKVGAKAEIDATTTSDLSNAYDFEVVKGE